MAGRLSLKQIAAMAGALAVVAYISVHKETLKKQWSK
jgi:uncharacterized membrane protein YkgB